MGIQVAALILGSLLVAVGALHVFRPYALDWRGWSLLFGMPTRSLSRGTRRFGAVFTVMFGVLIASLGMLSMLS